MFLDLALFVFINDLHTNSMSAALTDLRSISMQNSMRIPAQEKDGGCG